MEFQILRLKPCPILVRMHSASHEQSQLRLNQIQVPVVKAKALFGIIEDSLPLSPFKTPFGSGSDGRKISIIRIEALPDSGCGIQPRIHCGRSRAIGRASESAF